MHDGVGFFVSVADLIVVHRDGIEVIRVLLHAHHGVNERIALEVENIEVMMMRFRMARRLAEDGFQIMHEFISFRPQNIPGKEGSKTEIIKHIIFEVKNIIKFDTI